MLSVLSEDEIKAYHEKHIGNPDLWTLTKIANTTNAAKGSHLGSDHIKRLFQRRGLEVVVMSKKKTIRAKIYAAGFKPAAKPAISQERIAEIRDRLLKMRRAG